MGRRSQIDQRLAEELARGQTLAKAAEAAGCSQRTAERRWAEPDFRDLVIRLQEDARKEREALLRLAWDRGGRLVGQAMVAIQDVFQDPNATHLDKTRAARLVLRAYGPKEEPPPLKVTSVEDEQRAAAMAEQTRRLLEQMGGNVHQLHPPAPPPPAWTPPPEPTWTPPPTPAPVPEATEDLDDEDDQPAGVAREYGKTAVPEPAGTLEPEPEPAEELLPVPAAELVPVDEEAEALRFLREHPRRPPAGPELMAWLEARKVVGWDAADVPGVQAGGRRRRRRRG